MTVISSIRPGILPILVGLISFLWSIAAASIEADARQRFALIISNKDYVHTAPVDFAERDSAAIEQLMVNALSVPKEHIFIYRNASMADLRFVFGDKGYPGHITNILNGRDSELYVYFVGHGSKEADAGSRIAKPYLLGIDSRPDDLGATAYSLNLLIEQLDRLQKSFLPEGRIRLILESCFSGRSDAGELITGVSAPALTLPLDFAMKKNKANNNVIVMSAAQSDEFAIWDKGHQQSLFTDALVSGMFGEADEKRFGGNDDGQVSLGEIRRFVNRRIARRVRIVRPGAEQRPDILGGNPDEILVKASGIVSPWPETIRRRHRERLMSGMMLARGDASRANDYLKTCVYCPRKTELRKFIFEHNRNQAICEIENPTIDRLLINGTVGEIQSFKEDCECCGRTKELDARLVQLQSPVASLSEPAAGDPPTGANVPSSTVVAPEDAPDQRQGETSNTGTQSSSVNSPLIVDQPLLARVLQTELHRVGCLVGKIDGKWGPISREALRRFNMYQGLASPALEPTSETVNRVVAASGRVCPLVCGTGQTRKGNRCVQTVKRKSKPKQRASTNKKRKTSTRRTVSRKTTTRRTRSTPSQRVVKKKPKATIRLGVGKRRRGGGGVGFGISIGF